MLSEILAPLSGCHRQLLLDDLRGRWSFGMKSELEWQLKALSPFPCSIEQGRFFLFKL